MKLLKLNNIYNDIFSILNYFIKKFLLNISIKKGLNYLLVRENLKNVKDIYEINFINIFKYNSKIKKNFFCGFYIFSVNIKELKCSCFKVNIWYDSKHKLLY